MKKAIVLNLFAIACLLIILAIYTAQVTNTSNSVKETKYVKITDEKEAHDIITSNDSKYVTIDLRDKEDYIKAHIKNSFNFPYDKHIEELKNFINRQENESKTIVLICYSGNRSSKAFEDLVISGATNIIDISIGYDRYSKMYEGQYSVDYGDCQCTKE